jgi:hypothetical protein
MPPTTARKYPRSDFGWLARDLQTAVKHGQCDRAKTLASQALLVARTPKERNATYTLQSKARSCTPSGLGRTKGKRGSRRVRG